MRAARNKPTAAPKGVDSLGMTRFIVAHDPIQALYEHGAKRASKPHGRRIMQIGESWLAIRFAAARRPIMGPHTWLANPADSLAAARDPILGSHTLGGTVGIDFGLLRDQCERTLAETHFSDLGTREAGKVRDNYVAGEHRYLVATDRVSCFDVVVSTLPFKGQILNQLAAFWFERPERSPATTSSKCRTPTSRRCSSASRCPSSSSSAPT